MKVKLGGPAYGGMVRVEHCAFMASMVANMAKAGIQVGFGYQQSTLLHWGRADWLSNAVDQGYNLALSCDADTWADPDDVFGDAMALMMLCASQTEDNATKKAIISSRPEFADIGANMHRIAMLGFVVGRRNGKANAWDAEGHYVGLEAFAENAIIPVYAIGSAILIFNLDWYRKNPRQLQRKWDCPVDGHSEDFTHCRAIAKAGGIVLGALSNTFHCPNDAGKVIQCRQPMTTDLTPLEYVED